MPIPDQDASLQALVAGQHPEEIVFDPITDNDSTGSCLGCAYSVLAGAAVLIGLYVGGAKGVALAERFTDWAGRGGLAFTFCLIALSVFAVIETFAAKEIFVLVTETRRLELRLRKSADARVLKVWESNQVLRFTLDQPADDPEMRSGLYVQMDGEEPIRLLEASYPRSFVEQVERELSALYQVPSTTA